MQLIILSKDKGLLGQFSAGRVWLGLSLAAVAICAVTFYTGFRAAELFGVHNPSAQVAEWQAEIQQGPEEHVARRARKTIEVRNSRH